MKAPYHFLKGRSIWALFFLLFCANLHAYTQVTPGQHHNYCIALKDSSGRSFEKGTNSGGIGWCGSTPRVCIAVHQNSETNYAFCISKYPDPDYCEFGPWDNANQKCPDNPADNCDPTEDFYPPSTCVPKPPSDPDGDMDGDGTPNKDDDDINGNGQKNTCDPTETVCILDACDTCTDFQNTCAEADCSGPNDGYPEGGRTRDQDGNIWETKSSHCRTEVTPPRCYAKKERTGWQDPNEPLDQGTGGGSGTGGGGDGSGGNGTGEPPQQPIEEQKPSEKKNSWSDKDEIPVKIENTYDPTTNTETTTETKRVIDSAGQESIIKTSTKKNSDGSTTTTTTTTKTHVDGSKTTTTTKTEKDASGTTTGTSVTGESVDKSGTKDGKSDEDREGEGSASGGDGCDKPPKVVGGDPLLAMQIKQQWLTRCKDGLSGELNERTEFAGYESLESEVNDAKQAYQDTFNQVKTEAGDLFGQFSTGGGSLPAFSFNWRGQQQDVNMTAWGNKLINFSTILIFAASVFACVIIMRK